MHTLQRMLICGWLLIIAGQSAYNVAEIFVTEQACQQKLTKVVNSGVTGLQWECVAFETLKVSAFKK